MRGRTPVVGGLLTLAAIAAGGCQSTQDKSSELAKQGQKAFSEKGLTITKVNKDVKVTDSAVLTDQNGSAVAVELRNDSKQGFANVPIAIDVLDAKGKSVFKNNLAGLDPGLVSIAAIKPGETTQWVNDQVFATSKPADVKVEVGDAPHTLPSTLPELAISPPKIQVDPISGVMVSGTVTNKSDQLQKKLVLYAVARKGGKIAAAGRGGVARLDPHDNKPYHIFFIGDPRGADVTVTAPPVSAK